ncbi:MAG: enoyl-CoA hydratase [Pseudonocardiales bacterium]|jgi:enoyl-CoA hydratase|nr:enoyl-CoA hydratase [Pseudonocardiales bacterium]
MTGVDVAVADRIMTITINRPEKRNALSIAMREEFAATLLGADTDDDVSALIITGVDPAFCAGVDTSEFGVNKLTAHDRRYRVTPVRALFSLRKPVIAAVNGACVTGGLELALACDFIIASDRAQFADTHAQIGAMPTWGMTALLPRAVGVRYAKQLSLTGERISAHRALEAGLVNEVVAHDELEQRARTMVTLINKVDPAIAQTLLGLYDRGDGASLAEALAFEADASADRVANADLMTQRSRQYRSDEAR